MNMNFADFDDPVKNECEGKKPIHLDRDLMRDFVMFCRANQKDPQCVAEYLIKLGIHTPNENRVCIDIGNL